MLGTLTPPLGCGSCCTGVAGDAVGDPVCGCVSPGGAAVAGSSGGGQGTRAKFWPVSGWMALPVVLAAVESTTVKGYGTVGMHCPVLASIHVPSGIRTKFWPVSGWMALPVVLAAVESTTVKGYGTVGTGNPVLASIQHSHGFCANTFWLNMPAATTTNVKTASLFVTRISLARTNPAIGTLAVEVRSARFMFPSRT